mmetsp:Transcript_10842/g.20115  ORF Transcript_10842/g.20115 Transcript_10842/m.20115 type:complete len:221 (-) Transcript_10842:1122-1784(-)
MLPGMHIQEKAILRGEVHPLIIESYIISRYFVGRFIPLRSSRTNHKFVLPLRKVRQPFDRPRNLISLVAVPFRRQEHGFRHHHIIGFRIIITIQVTIAVVAAGAFLSFLQHFSSAALPVTDGKRSLRRGFAPSVLPPRRQFASAPSYASAVSQSTSHPRIFDRGYRERRNGIPSSGRPFLSPPAGRPTRRPSERARHSTRDTPNFTDPRDRRGGTVRYRI